MNFRIRGGSVIGRSHLLSSHNSQDSFTVREKCTEEGLLLTGVVTDGCGSAPNSELGAQLFSAFAAEKLVSGPVNGKLLPRVSITAIWLRELVRSLSSNFKNREEFLFGHLLATCLGVVTNGEECIIFHRGDGYIFIGDEVLELDEGNQPNYLAYDALKKAPWDGAGIGIIEVNLREVERVAVATDGFEPELIDLFWGKEHPNGVQRQLNSLSRKKHFTDDASLVVVELLREVDEDGSSAVGENT